MYRAPFLVPHRDRRWLPRRLRSEWWLWLLPVFVLYAMKRWPPARIEHLTGAIAALGIVSWAVRRPGRALVALIVFVPLQNFGFGFLLRLNVPGQILKSAGAIKELLALGIIVSALHALRVGRTRRGLIHQLDGLDKALLIYVTVVTVYMLVPHLFTLAQVADQWNVRLLAWRADCGYVLLFFGVRHAPIPAATRRRVALAVTALAVLTLVVAFYQWLQPDEWVKFIVVTGRQVQYQLSVLGNSAPLVAQNLGYLTLRNPLRVGSIFLGPFDMADFLLIPFGLALERITRGVRSLPACLLGAGILAALFASRVRADALAAIVVAIVAMAPAPTKPISARLRLLGAVVLATVIVVPVLGGTRFVNAQGGAQSNKGHVTELSAGFKTLVHNPLGLGIGNVAGVGDRFVLSAKQIGAFTVDNAVLQVGDELGVQALVPWLIMLALTWRALTRTARRADPFAGGVRLAFLAVLVAGMYHHVFLGFPVAWVVWAAIGLALNTSDERAGTTPVAGPVNPEVAKEAEGGPSKISVLPADAGRG